MCPFAKGGKVGLFGGAGVGKTVNMMELIRTIAMGSSDGLRRGLEVKDLEHPIEVPVGIATLGRIMNVLGEPVDMKGEIGEEERWAIHRAARVHQPLGRGYGQNVRELAA